MDCGLRDRVYIVSGASAGLGLATAAVLVADGARVLINSRDPARIEAAAEHLGDPDRCQPQAGDLGRPETAAELVSSAIERFGRLDGAVISVGGPPAGSVADTPDQAWRDSFETVFLGPLRLARQVLATGEQRAVTFILSTSVKSPIANLGLSNGLRPGLAMVAKTLADEYGPAGHRVNCILPGRIDTDRIRELESAAADPEAVRAGIIRSIPLGRYGRPEELGTVAAFVSSPAASYLNGVALAVDGGMSRSL